MTDRWRNEEEAGTPAEKNGKSGSAAGMEDNLKKALSEMLVLYLLREKDRPVNEITAALSQRSGGTLNVVFPYALLYRLIDFRYIYESVKKTAPDGRRRQYFRITEAGLRYLEDLLGVYGRFIGGVQLILAEGEEYGREPCVEALSPKSAAEAPVRQGDPEEIEQPSGPDGAYPLA